MKRYRIFKLIFHVAYSCNMSCKGCLAISDVPREGVQDYDDILETIRNWAPVLDPSWIMIFGGEPLLHPRIKDIITELRRHWPNAGISLPTNGLLLRKIMDRDWLESVKPIEVRVSLHRNDNEGRFFKPLIAEFMEMYSGWQHNLIGFDNVTGLPESSTVPYLFSWIKDRVVISVAHYENFIVPYTYDDQGRVAPHHSDPDEAWSNCVSPELVFLYKKKLWKCIPYPNLQDVVNDFDQRWPSYIPYSHSDDLTPYFAEMCKSNTICSMCPNSRSAEAGHIISRTSMPETVKILPSKHWISKNILNVGK
jgi:hypothetical protein